jgi:hypothetical protein
MSSMDIGASMREGYRTGFIIASVPYTFGPSQVLAIPLILICVYKIAESTFKTHNVDVSTPTLTPDEKYNKKIERLKKYNDVILWTSRLAAVILNVAPLIGGPIGFLVQEKMLANLQIWPDIINTPASRLNLKDEEIVDIFRLKPDILKNRTEFSYIKDRIFLLETMWPGIDRSNISTFLYRQYYNNT